MKKSKKIVSLLSKKTCYTSNLKNIAESGTDGVKNFRREVDETRKAVGPPS